MSIIIIVPSESRVEETAGIRRLSRTSAGKAATYQILN